MGFIPLQYDELHLILQSQASFMLNKNDNKKSLWLFDVFCAGTELPVHHAVLITGLTS